MRRMPWPAYLWPGLPQLARDGNWTALAVAVAAGILINTALLGTWFWTDLFAPGLRIIVWATVGVAWCVAAGYGARSDRRRARTPEKTSGKIFTEALEEYLKGNWFEAERKLTLLVRRDEHDVEARLMMATLMRHTRRWDEATRQLNLLVRLDGASRWAQEIRREGELLMEARKSIITSVNPEQESKGEN